MSYQPIPLSSFGALRLDADPQDLGWEGATDLLDVDIDGGRVRTRDGLSLWATQTAAFTALGVLGQQIVTADGTNLKLWSPATGITGTVADTTGDINVQAFGTPSFTGGYVARGTAATIRKISTTGTWSAPAGMPQAVFLARQDTDNRLVAARVNGNESRVQFSAAGDAETWGANDFIDLAPGDAENITGVAAWREFVFVFKESAFWVFYGNTTDTSGDTSFNNRVVRGFGARQPSTMISGAVAGSRGVYFLGRDYRVWRTTGGAPESVSGPVDAWLQNDPLPYFTALALRDTHTPRLAAAAGRVFVTDTTAGGGTLVYDEARSEWTVYSWQSLRLAAIEGAGGEQRPVFIPAGATGGTILFQNPEADDDNATTISARYQTGFSDLGSPGIITTAREFVIDGTGSVDFSVAVDDGDPDTGAPVTLGAGMGEGRDRRSRQGRNMALKLSGNGRWQVNRVVANLRSQRTPGRS